MSEIEFQVQNGPGPRLVGPEEPPPDTESSSAVAEAEAAAQLALPEWTPAECSALVAALFTSGLTVAFIVRQLRFPDPEVGEWEALVGRSAEFPLCGMALAPLANRFLPKSGPGGLVPAAVGAVGGAGEVAIASVRRLPLLLQRRRGGRPAPAAAPAPEAPAEPEGDASGQFRFPSWAREMVG